ncbi:metallophosphoesterase [Hyphomicrobium sp.]|jgi:serine/threonine protein phosphatase 1|uniref:metallophosphoesterase n=1 Tax=Hyphomicrobium sp. TaxID=82 RepID=UPI00356607C6
MSIDLLHYPSPEAVQATSVYVIADLHGRLDLAREMEAVVLRDIAKYGPKKPVICVLGDYIDRGPDSCQLLSWLTASPFDRLPCVFLKGNHEAWMLSFLIDPVGTGINWLLNGGADTVESYGINIDDDPDDADWLWLRSQLLKAIPPVHLSFLEELRLAFVWDQFICVHAGINPRRPLNNQDEDDLLWIREPFLNSRKDFGYRIVHGHTIVEKPQLRKNRIGIDTGAFDSDVLYCAVLTRSGVRLLKVGTKQSSLGSISIVGECEE